MQRFIQKAAMFLITLMIMGGLANPHVCCADFGDRNSTVAAEKTSFGNHLSPDQHGSAKDFKHCCQACHHALKGTVAVAASFVVKAYIKIELFSPANSIYASTDANGLDRPPRLLA